MKIKIAFDVEILGELDEAKAREIFFNFLELQRSVITSEDVTCDKNNDAYALIVNGWSEVESNDLYKKLQAEQIDLDAESKKILHTNLWNLYN